MKIPLAISKLLRIFAVPNLIGTIFAVSARARKVFHVYNIAEQSAVCSAKAGQGSHEVRFAVMQIGRIRRRYSSAVLSGFCRLRLGVQ